MYWPVFFVLLGASLSAQPEKPTPPIDLAKELIRGTSALERIRVSEEKELATATDATSKLYEMIHFCTRMTSELQTQQFLVDKMNIADGDLASFAKHLSESDQMRAGYFSQIKVIVQNTLRSNQPAGYDAGAEASKIPEIIAMRATVPEMLLYL